MSLTVISLPDSCMHAGNEMACVIETSLPLSTDNLEILFVIAKNSSISLAAQFPVGGDVVGIFWGGTYSTGTGIGVFTTSGGYASTVEDTDIHLASAIPTASLHIDGVLQSNISLSGIIVKAIGGKTDTANLNMVGSISEVILSSAAETVNRSDIESNINNSYSPSIL